MNSVTEALRLARQLRAQGQFEKSFQLVTSVLGQSPDHAGLVWQHQPIFWSDINNKSCSLSRRQPADAAFMRTLWADPDFKQKFHRQAPDLPEGDELERVLNFEYTSLMSESKAIHWVIRCKNLKPWGILSLTDISLQHRRAEVLIGLQQGAPIGLSISAMLSLFTFFFDAMHFKKMVAFIYADNLHASQVAFKLGFKLEGHLEAHMHDPKSNSFVDLQQLGLFKTQALSAYNSQLANRFLNR